jgi:hypothetical protein
LQQFDGAVITEQNITFAIAIVKPYVLNNHAEANRLIATYQQTVFGGIPVVLMAQDSRGIPTFYGRRDIAKFLSRVPVQAIPWRRYSIA